MKNYDTYLYDDIGNRYERKNEYIKELIQLQEKKDKQGLKVFINNKKQHAYNKQLEAFKEEEKAFKAQLKEKKVAYNKEASENKCEKLRRLKLHLMEASEKVDFYKDYRQLCYDAELVYRDSLVVKEQLGEIITHLENSTNSYREAKKAKKELTPSVNQKAVQDYKCYRLEQKEDLKHKVAELKTKKKQGSISKKALKNEKQQLKAEYEALLRIKKYEIPKKALQEEIESKRYEVEKVTKQKLTVMNDNRSNVRRTTPCELRKTKSFHGIIGLFLPGVGQLLNKQYTKAAFYAVATLFIYLIAIPYALGYGNYQGSGIAGLLSLAEGAPKIHKSLIYMIEGIIAVFLSVIACLLLLVSYKDTNKVEKDGIRGIRSRNWFETKRAILEDGFPYLVSLPTLVVIVFIVIVPITTAILLSFTNMDPKNQSKFSWIGVSNYVAIAKGEGMAGTVFWNILGWTVLWTLIATTFAIVLGFFLALLANNERIKGKMFFRTIYLLPWAVPAFITIMFFSIMLSREGILTEVIHQFTGLSFEVKNDTYLARITLILLQGWLGSSYVFLLATGVLQSIPSDLYEAAEIDGASAWQKLRRITVPMVLFQTAPLLIGQYTFNFNNFSIIYLFNGGGPFNPKEYGNLAGSTDLLISYIFKLTMDNKQQAIGAAITIVISLGLMVFAFIGFKNSKAFKEERL